MPPERKPGSRLRLTAFSVKTGHGKRNPSRLSHALLCVCLIFLQSAVGWSQIPVSPSNPDLLEVATPRFGFDGTIRELSFMPLTVEVRNRSSAIWRGPISLHRGRGLVDTLSLPITMDLLLQPDEARVVQFVPYFVENYDVWTINWGPDPKHRIEIPSPRVGDDAIVLIDLEGRVSADRGTLRRMPEEYFPVSVTATESLAGVVLDGVPFWQGARAQAFRDWLMRGGTAVILHDPTGRYPDFQAPLEFLNIDSDRVAFGAGQIRRRPQQATEILPSQIQVDLYPDAIASARRDVNTPNSTAQSTLSTNALLAREALLTFLDERTVFHRPWVLIYLCVVGYLLALFPGCYLAGRQGKHVRTFYIVFFSCTVGFSLVFMLLGQLGARAQNRIRSLAIARPLEGNSYDLQQWSRIAAAKSGDYEIRHPGTGIQYSGDKYFEQETGEILAGRDALIRLQMPPASFQSILHRSRVAIPDRQPPVIQQSEFSGLQLDELTVIQQGSANRTVIESVAIYRGTLYPLQERGGIFSLDRLRKRSLLSVIEERTWDEHWGLQGPMVPIRTAPFGQAEEEEPQTDFSGALTLLLIDAWDLHDPNSLQRYARDGSHVWVASLEEMPAELYVESGDFPDQSGAVLHLSRHPVSP